MRFNIKEVGSENTSKNGNELSLESSLESLQDAEKKPESESRSEYLKTNAETSTMEFRIATESEKNKIIETLNNIAFSRSYKFETDFEYFNRSKIHIEGTQRNLPQSFCPEDDGLLEIVLSKPYFYASDVKVNGWSWSYNLRKGESLGFACNADTDRDMKGVGPSLNSDPILSTNKFFIFDNQREDIKEIEVTEKPNQSIDFCRITFKDSSVWKNRVMELKVDWNHLMLRKIIVEDSDSRFRFTTSFHNINL